MRNFGTWSELIGQLFRYGLVGGASTILHVSVYWGCAAGFVLPPLLSNLLGYLTGVIFGYVGHSQWSFKGHGNRERPIRSSAKFVLASLSGLALNSFWVWLLVDRLSGPVWLPMPLMVVVTPLWLFALIRLWVFR